MESCHRLGMLLRIPEIRRIQLRHYKPAKLEEIKTRRKRNPSVSVLNARIIGVEQKHEPVEVHDFRKKVKKPIEEHVLYKEEACYFFQQRTRLLEGVKQALYLSKSKMMAEEMPSRLQHLADTVEIPHQEDEVFRSIEKSRLFDETVLRKPWRRRKRWAPPERFSYTQLMCFLNLCGRLTPQYPSLLQRAIVNDYTLAAPYRRGKDRIQIGGRVGSLITSKLPLLPLAIDEEVQETASHQLESLYPIAHTIDLAPLHHYRDDHVTTGLAQGYPYPHAHLLLVLNTEGWLPEHLDAKLILFAFGNCLARAKLQYGVQNEDVDLETPIVTHAVGTNGRRWSFASFQLNTLKLRDDDGIKNMVWLESNKLLYWTITRKDKRIAGVRPEVFRKFLAYYLDGGVSV